MYDEEAKLCRKGNQFFSSMFFFCSKVAETPQESAEEIQSYARYKYPTMTKTQGNFRLRVSEGEFTDSQIIVMLGENGTGKTTFIRMLVFSSSMICSLVVRVLESNVL